MARVVTELRCSSEPAARHTAATKGRPRARATDLAQSAVHFAHIGTFSAIFSEVDCSLGHPRRQHPHQQQGRATHSRDPTTQPRSEITLWRYEPLPCFFADHPQLRMISYDLALAFYG